MLAQAHQHDIDGHPVQPSGESRVTAKSRDLSVQLEEGFLRQVLCQPEITHHA